MIIPLTIEDVSAIKLLLTLAIGILAKEDIMVDREVCLLIADRC